MIALPPTPARGMRTFVLIVFGQIISLLGSELTNFGLGVWVYQHTHAATPLTFISFLAVLPMIVCWPIAGALVDRWDRRRMLLLSEAGAAVTPFALLLLIVAGRFAIWQIYVVVAISAAFIAFQFPAIASTTSLLIPKDQLGRANGLLQLGPGIARLCAPVLVGVLIGVIDIQGIFLIDAITFLISISILLAIRIPKPSASVEGQKSRASFLREITSGWTYIRTRPGLLALLLLFVLNNYTAGTVLVLVTPMVLSFASPAVLGTIVSIAGSGFLVGGVVLSIWGGPKRRIVGVFAGFLLGGLCVLIAGLQPSAVLIGAATFCYVFASLLMTNSSQTIWQSKVPPDLQGRVFATTSMIANVTMPLAFLVSGPLADRVFVPLLVEHGPLAGSVGQFIGVGPGRGIGLLFIILGVLMLLLAIPACVYPRLRLVEHELPDSMPDQAKPEGSRPAQATP